jgi:hypothetical protein
MPELVHFALASHAALDSFSGQVSLLFLWESVQPIGLVAEHENPDEEVGYLLGSVALFTNWWRQDGEEGREYEQRVTIHSPDGREAVIQPPSQFSLQRPFHRVVHRIQTLMVRQPGLFWARLQLRALGDEQWNEVARRPFMVQEVPQEQLPEPFRRRSAPAE